ncbi:MAG: HEAT repeat domain-containing protein, partial [Elusimicrobiota bacterium]
MRSILIFPAFFLALSASCLGVRAQESPAPPPAPQDPFTSAVSGLKAQDPMVRRRSADELGRWGTPASIAPLTQTLADENPFVRSAAVDALGILRAREAVSKIAELLAKDPAPQVRQQAAIALAYVGDSATEDAL